VIYFIDEPWDSLGTWVFDGGGEATINPAGQLRLTPTENHFVGLKKSMPFDSKLIVKFRGKVDNFGDNGGAAFVSHPYGITGQKTIGVYFYIKEHTIEMINNDNEYEPIECETDNNWHEWRLRIDVLKPEVKVYKDDVLVGIFTDIYMENFDPPNIPYVEFGSENTSGDGCIVHYDWSKVYLGVFARMGFKQAYNMDDEVASKSKEYKQMFGEEKPDIVDPDDKPTWGNDAEGFPETYGRED